MQAGSKLGKAIPLVGFALGMGSDMSFEKKTFGEALAHNGFTTAAALLTTAGFVTTAPAWLVVRSGIGLGLAADYAYQTNFLGIKDGLDAVGHKIDEGEKWLGDKLNPFNWGR